MISHRTTAILAVFVSGALLSCATLEKGSGTSDSRGSSDGFVLEQEELEALHYHTVEDILVGRLPGARASSAGMSDLRVRGAHSIAGNNEPLFIIDGIRAAAAARMLNPHDLARIEVLRGPTAVARYGSQGVNGVVLIETKRARE